MQLGVAITFACILLVHACAATSTRTDAVVGVQRALLAESNEPYFWMSTSVPNKKFVYDENVALNRAEAQAYCQQIGGQLATIVNAEEQYGLDQFMQTGNSHQDPQRNKVTIIVLWFSFQLTSSPKKTRQEAYRTFSCCPQKVHTLLVKPITPG
jgi:hypothetical protein